MKKEFIVNRQGKDFVLYAGLLDQAHREGLKRITTKLIQAPSDENGRLAICYAEVETEKGVFSGIGDASPENVGRMIAAHTVRMAECVPLVAQLLTRAGWKYYDELTIGEEVLAYDIMRDQCAWTPLQAVSVFPEAYETLRLSSRSFDVTCTPNHTWVAAQQQWATRLVQAQQLRRRHKIVVAAPAEGGDNPLTPREAALLGWLATDGWISERMVGRWGPYKRAVIAQSKPAYITEIEALVGLDGSHQRSAARLRTFAAGYTSTCLPASKFELTAQFTRDLLAKAGMREWTDLPQIATRLSVVARVAMLDAMLKGDGTSRDGRRWVFGQKAKPGVTETFTILATLQGIALGRPRQSTSGEVPVWSLRENRHISAAYLTIEPGVSQPVWCPTTAYGTWVMNLNGCITITGNTRAKARALRDAINVGVTALEELAEADEDTSETMPRQLESANRRPVAAVPRPTPARAEPAAEAASDGAAPATPQQIDRLLKLQAAVGRPGAVPQDLTSEAAAAQIRELVGIFNAQSRGGRAQAR